MAPFTALRKKALVGAVNLSPHSAHLSGDTQIICGTKNNFDTTTASGQPAGVAFKQIARSATLTAKSLLNFETAWSRITILTGTWTFVIHDYSSFF